MCKIRVICPPDTKNNDQVVSSIGVDIIDQVKHVPHLLVQLEMFEIQFTNCFNIIIIHSFNFHSQHYTQWSHRLTILLNILNVNSRQFGNFYQMIVVRE